VSVGDTGWERGGWPAKEGGGRHRQEDWTINHVLSHTSCTFQHRVCFVTLQAHSRVGVGGSAGVQTIGDQRKTIIRIVGGTDRAGVVAKILNTRTRGVRVMDAALSCPQVIAPSHTESPPSSHSSVLGRGCVEVCHVGWVQHV
jgi:hypothetical protein